MSEKSKACGAKIFVTNVPVGVEQEKLESLFSSHGDVLALDFMDDQTVCVVYQTKEEAEKAVKALDDTDFENVKLHVRTIERKSPKKSASSNSCAAGANAASNNSSCGNSSSNTPSQHQPSQSQVHPHPHQQPHFHPHQYYHSNNTNSSNHHNNNYYLGSNCSAQRGIDFPLRILVKSDMVGAIIGRGGQTIRQITQQTRARVDVHRKENIGSEEKAITIYGQPENCTNACQHIMKVMLEEAKTTGKAEDIPLKILAHNSLIGRIIGKQGATIKKIMDDTNAKITVSSVKEINSFNLERVITIRGGMDEISKAENEISSKLRAAFESDVQAMVPHNVMYPGVHSSHIMPSQAIMGYPPGSTNGALPRPHNVLGNSIHNYSAYNGGVGLASALGGALKPSAPFSGLNTGVLGRPSPPAMSTAAAVAAAQCNETSYLYIPSTAVGAIIGAKGSHIRNIIKISGAHIKIAPPNSSDGDACQEKASSSPVAAAGTAVSGATTLPSDRKITIHGPPESQWKAQYLIYQKLREEGFAAGGVDVQLTVEIMVPTSQVGRIIGKGGTNVRELQRLTHTMIKLPEQGTSSGEETPVHISGIFYSVQSAQRRLRATVQSTVASRLFNGHGSSAPSSSVSNMTHTTTTAVGSATS